MQRASSTVLPELGRNTADAAPYAASTAQQATTARREAGRPSPKLQSGGVLRSLMTTLLNWKYSPQQIAGTLLRVYPEHPEHPKLHVSHETVYSAITLTPSGGAAPRDHRLPAPGPRQTAVALAGHRPAAAGKSPKVGRGRAGRAHEPRRLASKMPHATAASALQAFTTKLQSPVAPLRQSMTDD